MTHRKMEQRWRALFFFSAPSAFRLGKVFLDVDSKRAPKHEVCAAWRGVCIDAIVGSTTPGRAKDLLSCEP